MEPGLLPVLGRLQNPGRKCSVVADTDILGGLQVVSDDAERDAIPNAMRKAGMIARYPSGTEYTLEADLETWTRVADASDYGRAPIVTGLAELKALPVHVGQRVHETLRGFDWKVFPEGTSIANDRDVVDGNGGQLFLIPGTSSHAMWRETHNWFVGNRAVPETGEIAASDWNSGDATHPLQTTDEIDLRYGRGAVLSFDMSIFVLGDIDHVSLTCVSDSPSRVLSIVGNATQIASLLVATYASHSHGSSASEDPLPARMSATAGVQPVATATWLLYSQARYRLRIDDNVSWIDTPTPCNTVASYGANVATVAQWQKLETNTQRYVPSVGAAVVVERLPAVGNVFCAWTGLTQLVSMRIDGHVRVATALLTLGCFLSENSTFAVDSQNNSVEHVGVRFESKESRMPASYLGGIAYNTTLLVNGYGVTSAGIRYVLSRVTTAASASTYNFGHYGVGDKGYLSDVMAFQHSSANVIRFGDNGGITTQPKVLTVLGFSCISYLVDAICMSQGTRIVVNKTSYAFNPITKNASYGDFSINTLNPAKNVGGFSWSDVVALHAAPFRFDVGVWRGTCQLALSDNGQKTIDLSPKLSALFDATPRVWIETPADAYGNPFVLSKDQNASTFVLKSASYDTSLVAWEVRSNNTLDCAIWVR